MKIEFVTNRVFSIEGEVEPQLNSVAEAIIATAFIDSYSIDIFEQAILRNKNLKHIKLLIGLYGFFNKKDDLVRLSNLAAKHADKIQIHISRNAQFHWKYYFFKQKQKEIYYVGSANLTTGGLKVNSELLLKVSPSLKDKSSINKTLLEFGKEWDNSVAISSIKLDLYNERIPKKNEKDVSSSFKMLFPEEEAKQVDSIVLKSEKAVVLLLTHDLSSSTIKMVSNNFPQWKEYVSQDTKVHFQNCLKYERLLIIDRIKIGEYKWYWAFVTDSSDHLKTVDGKYFIAYKISGKSKKLTLNQLEELKSSKFGIDVKARKKPFYQKVLGAKQVERLIDLLK